MKRIHAIMNHDKFLDYMRKNQEYEEHRVFCHHDLSHVIDVARIAYILCLERRDDIPKDIIYACALLHDIGRWKEYEVGLDHALISSEMASAILADAGFKSSEIQYIQEAIKNHRNKGLHPTRLSKILYTSDKLSRPCNQCSAKPLCKRFTKSEEYYLEY
ncbi:MAG: HD domain-containing protein [Eubacteriales bacterium]